MGLEYWQSQITSARMLRDSMAQSQEATMALIATLVEQAYREYGWSKERIIRETGLARKTVYAMLDGIDNDERESG
jgi:hypothetical protein